MKIPTKRQYEMHDAVVRRNMSFRDTASAFATSLTTVRRACDAVTEFRCRTIEMELSGQDWKEIIGWLRNGNFTANDLADRITAHINGNS